MMSYPLDIYHKNKDTKLLKKEFNLLYSKLYYFLENWKDLNLKEELLKILLK